MAASIEKEAVFPKGGGAAEMHKMEWAPVVVASLACRFEARTIRYVDDDAPPRGDGLSWGAAYRFLRDALTGSLSQVDPMRCPRCGQTMSGQPRLTDRRGAGDVDGDGLDDVIVGAPGTFYGHDAESRVTQPGRSWPAVENEHNVPINVLACLNSGSFDTPQ